MNNDGKQDESALLDELEKTRAMKRTKCLNELKRVLEDHGMMLIPSFTFFPKPDGNVGYSQTIGIAEVPKNQNAAEGRK